MTSASSEKRIWMYQIMVKSRQIDDRLIEIYAVNKLPVFDFAAGPLPGELHSSNGQEPCAVGVCAQLGADDAVSTGHRPHHVAVARGVDLKRLAAELFGKKAGLSGGRGGHMHIYDKNVNFASSGIVAEGLGVAAGQAMARKMRNLPGIAVTFFGEGAANQGAFHEVLNMASLWKLPVVFIIEDNDYGVTTSKARSTAVEHNAERAAAYSMPGDYVEGNDPDLIYERSGVAIERARSGGGPTLLELHTTRLTGHFWGDPQPYRPKDEVANLVDPIPRYRQRLLVEGVLTEEQAQRLEQEARDEANEAIQFGLDADYPEPEEALEKVFA